MGEAKRNPHKKPKPHPKSGWGRCWMVRGWGLQHGAGEGPRVETATCARVVGVHADISQQRSQSICVRVAPHQGPQRAQHIEVSEIRHQYVVGSKQDRALTRSVPDRLTTGRPAPSPHDKRVGRFSSLPGAPGTCIQALEPQAILSAGRNRVISDGLGLSTQSLYPYPLQGT